MQLATKRLSIRDLGGGNAPSAQFLVQRDAIDPQFARRLRPVAAATLQGPFNQDALGSFESQTLQRTCAQSAVTKPRSLAVM
jgi:hypothetical protein